MSKEERFPREVSCFSPLFGVPGFVRSARDEQIWKYKEEEIRGFEWGKEKKIIRPFSSLLLFRQYSVVQLSSGSHHLAFLTSCGRLFTFGANNLDQCGLGKGSLPYIEEPTLVQTLLHKKVKSVVCGPSQTAAFIENENFYLWGFDSSSLDRVAIPSLFRHWDKIGEEKTLLQLHFGSQHTSIIVETKEKETEVWTWGTTQTGLLGDGENQSTHPTPVKIFGGESHIVQLAGSETHMCALDRSGRVYAWGDNRNGILWVGVSNPIVATPTLVQNLEAIEIVQIDCGRSFTVALSSATPPLVYTWGINDHGQLGQGFRAEPQREAQPPTSIEFFEKEKMEGICLVLCGEHHACALTKDRIAYLWGNGSPYCLNPLSALDYPVPAPLSELVIAVGLGSGSTFALFGDIERSNQTSLLPPGLFKEPTRPLSRLLQPDSIPIPRRNISRAERSSAKISLSPTLHNKDDPTPKRKTYQPNQSQYKTVIGFPGKKKQNKHRFSLPSHLVLGPSDISLHNKGSPSHTPLSAESLTLHDDSHVSFSRSPSPNSDNKVSYQPSSPQKIDSTISWSEPALESFRQKETDPQSLQHDLNLFSVAVRTGLERTLVSLLKKYDPFLQEGSIHFAVQHKQANIIEMLISHGAQVSETDLQGNTPLHVACSLNLLEISKLLVSHGASALATNRSGHSPLHVAMQRKYYLLFSYLLDQIPQNSISSEWFSDWMICAIMGRELRTVEELSSFRPFIINFSLKNRSSILKLRKEESHSPVMAEEIENRGEKEEKEEEERSTKASGYYRRTVTLIKGRDSKYEKRDLKLERKNSFDSQMWNEPWTSPFIRTASLNSDPSLIAHLVSVTLSSEQREENMLITDQPVRVIDMSSCLLLKVPDGLFSFRGVIDLNLSDNRLSEIPLSISRLQQLQRLDVSRNNLQSLPFELGKLEQLTHLNISANPLLDLPSHLRRNRNQNAQPILAYLRQMNKTSNWKYVKLMLLGDEGVGKSTLLKTLCPGTKLKETKGESSFLHFKQPQPDAPARSRSSADKKDKKKRKNITKFAKSFTRSKTESSLLREEREKKGIPRRNLLEKWKKEREEREMEVVEWKVGKDLVFRVWDFPSGNSLVNRFYITDRSFYVVCFDASRPNPSKIEYWLKVIKATTTDRPPIVLVGLKTDLLSLDESATEKVISDLSIRFSPVRFPNLKGIFMVSAINGNGIRELTKEVRKIGMGSKVLCSSVPDSYDFLTHFVARKRDYLSSLGDRVGIIPFAEFERETSTVTSLTGNELKQALHFLHDHGDVVYINHSSLQHLVILQPLILVQVIHNVVCALSPEDAGLLEKSRLPDIWNAYSKEHHSTFKLFLQVFDIAQTFCSSQSQVEGEEKEYYIIPGLLPSSRPSHQMIRKEWEAIVPKEYNQYERIYQFEFLPLGFFERFFVRALHLPGVRCSKKASWRNGMILEVRDRDFPLPQRCFVEINTETYKLRIRVRAPKERGGSLLRDLVEVIDTLLEGFYPQLLDTISISIPCSHCLEKRDILLDPYMFSVQECSDAVTSGVPFVKCCGISSRLVRIDTMAPDLAFSDVRMIPPCDVILDEVIGKGGFGVVFKGHIGGKEDQKEVAVKQLHNTKGSSDEFAEKYDEFKREVYIMSCLSHPCLVRLYGIVVNPLQMVLEFVGGGNLYRLLHSQEILPWDFRMMIIRDMALGMQYLHHAMTPPIAHRDFRSPNVFLTGKRGTDGEVVAKVADFGMSRRVNLSIGGLGKTWQWLAPEVIDADSIRFDEKSDLYSFGMVTWEILTREYPFSEYKEYQNFFEDLQGEDVTIWKEIAIKKAIISDHLRPSIPPDVAPFPELEKLIRDCWVFEPSERPSFHEIAKVVKGMLTQMELPIESTFDPTSDKFVQSGQHRYAGLSDIHEKVAHFDFKIQMDSPIGSAVISSQNHSGKAARDKEVEFRAYAMAEVEEEVWVGMGDGSIRIWIVDPFSLAVKLKAVIHPHQKRVYSLLYLEKSLLSEKEGCVLSAGDDGTIAVTRRESLEVVWSVVGHGGGLIKQLSLISVSPVSDSGPKSPISPRRKKGWSVWSLSPSDQTVNVWTLKHSQLEKSGSLNFKSSVSALIQYKASVWIGSYKELVVYNDKGSCILYCNEVAHQDLINAMAFTTSVDGDQMWTASNDQTIKIWRTDNYSLIRVLNVHSSRVLCLLNVGAHIWSGSFDKNIVIFDAQTHEAVQEIEGHEDAVRALMSPLFDLSHVWSSSLDGTIVVWSYSEVAISSEIAEALSGVAIDRAWL